MYGVEKAVCEQKGETSDNSAKRKSSLNRLMQNADVCFPDYSGNIFEMLKSADSEMSGR